MLSKVVLPAPFGPTNATTRPDGTAQRDARAGGAGQGAAAHRPWAPGVGGAEPVAGRARRHGAPPEPPVLPGAPGAPASPASSSRATDTRRRICSPLRPAARA